MLYINSSVIAPFSVLDTVLDSIANITSEVVDTTALMFEAIALEPLATVQGIWAHIKPLLLAAYQVIRITVMAIAIIAAAAYFAGQAVAQLLQEETDTSPEVFEFTEPVDAPTLPAAPAAPTIAKPISIAPQTTTKRRRGRPAGSKDSKPRAKRSKSTATK